MAIRCAFQVLDRGLIVGFLCVLGVVDASMVIVIARW